MQVDFIEKRDTPREREIRKKIEEIADKYGRMLQAESAPLLKELAEIAVAKDELSPMFFVTTH